VFRRKETDRGRRAAVVPVQSVSLDQVILSSPAVLIGGRMEETPRVDFVTGNIALFGLSPADLTEGRVTPETLILEEDREAACRSLAECASSGAAECVREYRLVTSSGEVRPVRDHRVFHRDGTGKAWAWQSTLLDLTGRKNWEHENRRIEENLAAVLAASRIWAWEYHPETDEFVGSGCFPVDGSWQAGLRFSRKKLWEGIVSQPDLARIEESWARLLEGDNRFSAVEHPVLRPDGTRGWVSIRAFPRLDGEGRVAGVTGLTVDITSLKEAGLKTDSQARHLGLLRSMSLGMMEDLDTDSLLERILRSAVEFSGAGNGVITLLEEGGKVLRYRCGIGLYEGVVGKIHTYKGTLCERALRERRPVWTSNYNVLDGRIVDLRFDPIRTIMVLPLFLGSHDFGGIGISFTDKNHDIDDTFLTTLGQFAAAASMALENARLHEAAQREIGEKIRAEGRLLAHGRLAAASAEASGFLLSQDHGETALGRALASLAEASGAGRAVLLRNAAEDGLAEVVARGEGRGALPNPVEDGPVRAAEYPLLFGHLFSGRTYLGPLNRDERPGIAAVPIIIRSGFWGFLALLFADGAPRFSAGEVDVLRTAAYNLAVSVGRWEAEKLVRDGYERLRKTFSDVIRTMGFIVGRKDPYTIEHQERVSVLAGEIGSILGLDPWKLEGLRICSLVHDVGKVEIPGEILSKPGRLSPMEFELIKTHAQSGYDILKEVDFPWPVAEVARQHHERMDGSGYPRGLKGEEILLEARILAVADVVEAMSSHRPYRPSLGMEASVAEISGKRGTAFDPSVVDACMEVLRKNPGIIAGELKSFGRGG